MKRFKANSLNLKNCEGENPLFLAARMGHKWIFRFFTGKIDFFKARADRNYKGQTIEHIVCLMSHYELIEAISPWPDTPDYEGNYPIFYTVQKNDS